MSRGEASASAAASAPVRASSSWAGNGDLEASLILVFPIVLAYELGALVCHRVNGVDFVTRALYGVLGSRPLYLLVHATIAAIFLLWIRRNGRWRSLRMEVVAPVALEAAIYALTLGALTTLVVDRWLGVSMSIGGAVRSIVGALGAGCAEETVFRLGMIGGVAWLCRDDRARRRLAVPAAAIGSTLLFAAAHVWAGEPWSMHAFACRCVAGAAFAMIFWYRSFAHAVYAHAMYDLVVAFV